MCRSNSEGGRRCDHGTATAARVMRRRRQKARTRLEDTSALSPYQQMLARGTDTYFHRGRLQCDLDAAADREFARRRHDLFLRELGLDESGADDDVRALSARRLHDAPADDPSRAWVTVALEDQRARDAWEATGASADDLYDRAQRGFADEHPAREDADAAAFVVGAVASA